MMRPVLLGSTFLVSFVLIAASLAYCTDSTAHLAVQLGHAGRVNSVAFTPDGRLLLTASDDGTIIIWEASTRRELRRFLGHNGSVHAIAVSADGTRVASAGEDHTARIWDLETGKSIVTLPHPVGVLCLAFSRDGKLLLTGGKDVVARVWAVDEGKQLFPLRRAAVLNAITTVAFSPDGHFALTGSSDGVLLWDLTTRKHVFSLGGQRERVKSVLFSPDGRLAVVAAKELVLWDVDKQQTVRTFARAKGVIECSSISSDGQFVAASITDYSDVSFANSQFVKKGESVPPTIQMWRLGADQPVQQYSSRSIVRSIAFSPGANDLLIGQVDGTALLLRAKTGAEIGSLSRETNTPTAATEAFVGLSPIVIVGTREGIVAKWNLDRGYLENR